MTNDEFMGSGFKTFPFDNPGDMVSGTVVELPTKEQQRDMKTGEPKVWPDGRPQWMFRVTILTELRDDEQDDGIRTLYLSWKRLDAVRNAIRAAGAQNIEVGGKLALRFDAYGPQTQKGFNPPKVGWTAWYKVPEATPAFMDNEPAPAPQPERARATAYDPAAATSTLDALRQARDNQSAAMQKIKEISGAKPADFPTSHVGTPAHHNTDNPPF